MSRMVVCDQWAIFPLIKIGFTLYRKANNFHGFAINVSVDVFWLHGK